MPAAPGSHLLCRFKSENILNLELDMPERTTYDYEGPGVDPRVQVSGGQSPECKMGHGALLPQWAALLFVTAMLGQCVCHSLQAVRLVDRST
jgi:hypothetical protein